MQTAVVPTSQLETYLHSGLISVFVLKNKVNNHNYLGVFLVLVGITFVALSSILDKSSDEGRKLGNPVAKVMNSGSSMAGKAEAFDYTVHCCGNSTQTSKNALNKHNTKQQKQPNAN